MWRVSHFDVSADDPQRAMKFYGDVFGWKFEKWGGPFDYWLVRTGDPDVQGIDGGLARREDPGARIVNFIDVPSVEECSRRIAASGGTIVQPRQAIPGVGYVLVFQDTEGNVVGILEADPAPS